MAYSRTTWENSPSTTTPLSANNLNNIETGILGVESSVSSLAGTVGILAGTAGTAVNITTTQGSVAATQGSVASTQGSVAATQGSVASTQGSVASTQGSVAATQGSVATINASLGSVAGTVSMGGLVFTNEAARDAAITSPTEGMRVYLTAPTVPAATGAITAVPTGIQTIYNGTSWVCITPVGASSQTSGTSTATAAGTTTLTGDAVAISVTLATGTTALVTISGGATTNTGTLAVIAFALSGATTQSASLISTGAGFAPRTDPAQPVTGTRSFIVTGMTAGTNTFTLNYWSSAAAALTWTNRNITVQGIA